MPILLYRVDERLIHGQVVVGWGAQLRPERIVVVDDELADSTWEQDLYRLGLPGDMEALFASVEAARERLPAWRSEPTRTLLLTRDVATMRRLSIDGGLDGVEVNLGGIHFAPGREPVLPYLFLSQRERRELVELVGAGATVVAQDLPASRAVDLESLL